MDFSNMGAVMKLMGAWNKFKQNHPKFQAILKAVSKTGIKEDTVLEIIVTTPEGEKIETSIKVTESDLELIQSLRQMAPQ